MFRQALSFLRKKRLQTNSLTKCDKPSRNLTHKLFNVSFRHLPRVPAVKYSSFLYFGNLRITTRTLHKLKLLPWVLVFTSQLSLAHHISPFPEDEQLLAIQHKFDIYEGEHVDGRPTCGWTQYLLVPDAGEGTYTRYAYQNGELIQTRGLNGSLRDVLHQGQINEVIAPAGFKIANINGGGGIVNGVCNNEFLEDTRVDALTVTYHVYFKPRFPPQVDVSVLATHQLEERDNATYVTYTITLTNEGTQDANNISVSAFHPSSRILGDATDGERKGGLPKQLHVTRVSASNCADIDPFAGGSLNCTGISLTGSDDPQGGNVKFIDIEARIINASDLSSVIFKATVPEDVNESNNEDTTTVRAYKSGSLELTRRAMDILDPYFDYQTDLRQAACNNYRADIYTRFEELRLQHPEIFNDLAFGPVTSGDYTTEVGSRAGHVGMVVYQKGTNYHETGIVVHGTPSVSPLGLFAGSYDTQVGAFEFGEQPTITRVRGTSNHGYYYRTPVVQFPGAARPEGAAGCGFEGVYSTNQNEFTTKTPPANCFTQSAGSCALDPSAVIVRTESPVDLLVTNSNGQMIETLGGQIVTQELEGGIHSMSVPHEDGTFGWTLVLPEDDYNIELIGVDNGPYKLTTTTFDEMQEPVDTVIEGTAQIGGSETFNVEAAHLAENDPTPNDNPSSDDPTDAGEPAESGGGGGVLFTLLPFLFLIRRIRFRYR